MRLLLIITDYGSFNNFLSELSLNLIKQEIDLHVACSEKKIINVIDKFKFDGIKFHFIDIPRNISIISELKVAYKLRKIVDEIKPDLVHSHFTTGTFPTILFKNSNYRYWGTFHGLGMNASSGFRRAIFTLVEKLCFNRLDRIFVVNDQDFNLVSKNYAEKVYKYDSYGFGCDINKFNDHCLSESEKTELKRSLNIGSEFVISFTGRYVAFKGFHIVIKTMLELERRYGRIFKFIIMGGFDPIHNTGLSKEDELLLDKWPMLINIGQTPNVERLLSISDLFLFPSKKEGLPTCVLEALSIGLPVITMNSRGNSDIVKNDYNGYLIPVDSENQEIENIVNCIMNLYNDRMKLKELSKHALTNRSSYSRSRFIDQHLELYNNINE